MCEVKIRLRREIGNVEGWKVNVWRVSRYPMSAENRILSYGFDYCHIIEGGFITYLIVGKNEDGYFDWQDAKEIAIRHYKGYINHV